MKTLVINLLALLILIMLSSCSTRKLNKQKFESASLVQSEIRMQELMNDKLEAKRKILLTDTTNEQYSVIIFPSDTFSFSAQHGFKGKAEKIEFLGKLRRVINLTDSAGLLKEKQRATNYEEKYESKKVEVSNSRILEKKGSKLVSVLIVVVVLILVGWWLWRGGGENYGYWRIGREDFPASLSYLSIGALWFIHFQRVSLFLYFRPVFKLVSTKHIWIPRGK